MIFYLSFVLRETKKPFKGFEVGGKANAQPSEARKTENAGQTSEDVMYRRAGEDRDAGWKLFRIFMHNLLAAGWDSFLFLYWMLGIEHKMIIRIIAYVSP